MCSACKRTHTHARARSLVTPPAIKTKSAPPRRDALQGTIEAQERDIDELKKSVYELSYMLSMQVWLCVSERAREREIPQYARAPTHTSTAFIRVCPCSPWRFSYVRFA